MNPYPTLNELSIIARGLPPFASNDRTGDARVAAYVYRGHAWLETNGGPVGVEDADAGGLAAECHLTLTELERARAASEANTALTGREAIAYAREYGLDLTKLADPTEEARVVTVDEAREIAKEDPSLITVEAPTWDPTRMVATRAEGHFAPRSRASSPPRTGQRTASRWRSPPPTASSLAPNTSRRGQRRERTAWRRTRASTWRGCAPTVRCTTVASPARPAPTRKAPPAARNGPGS